MRWLLAAVVLLLATAVLWRWFDQVAERVLPDPGALEQEPLEGVRFPVQVLDAEGRPAPGVRLVIGLQPAVDSGRIPVVASAQTGLDGRAAVWIPARRWERLNQEGTVLHLVARFPALVPPQVAFSPAAALESGQDLQLELPPAAEVEVELLEAGGDRSQRDFRLYLGWQPADPEAAAWSRSTEIAVPAPGGLAVFACGPGLRLDLWVARADGSGRKALGDANGPLAPGETLRLQRQLPSWKGPKPPVPEDGQG